MKESARRVWEERLEETKKVQVSEGIERERLWEKE